MPSIAQLPSNLNPPQLSMFPYWNPQTDTTEQTTLAGLRSSSSRLVLTDAATLTLDGTVTNVFDITLTANTTFVASGWADGETYTVILQQTAGFTVTWPAGTKWPGGTVPTQSTGANAIDLATLVNRGGVLLGRYAKGLA